jgi:hypothetical protein
MLNFVQVLAEVYKINHNAQFSITQWYSTRVHSCIRMWAAAWSHGVLSLEVNASIIQVVASMALGTGGAVLETPLVPRC